MKDPVLPGAVFSGQPLGRPNLGPVALTIIDGQRMTLGPPLPNCNRERRGRIEPARKKNDRPVAHD